ncbi:hypothetical protein ST47_g7739 [Ascochyta rabiei]|uniref:Uncharacterized protein n=2 Tax=Didymella rabiei TaxID=5454 RepID=A0A163ACW9_DIDRA|nr:hypothetical protein ST47_g7739 [Ascochyta rabiei]
MSHGYHESILSWTTEFHLQRDDCFPVMFAQRDIFNAGSKTESVNCRVVSKHINILVLQGTIIDRIGSMFPDWGRGMFSRSKDLTRQDRCRVDSVLQHTGLRDGRHGYSAPHILHLIYEGRAETPEYVPPTSKNAAKPPRDPESPTRAFWRTVVKDCAAPLRMRRLTTEGIEELDTMNLYNIKAGELPRTCIATGSPDAPDAKLEPIELP